MLYKTLRADPFPGVSMDQGPQIPWYSAVYTNNPNTAGYNPALELCDYWEQACGNLTPGGNLFQYAHLDVSGESPALLSAGVLLTDSDPGTDTVAGSLTDSVSGLCYGITLTTGGLTPNAEVGNLLFMVDLGIMKVIKANTANTLIFSLRDTLPQGLDVEALPAGPSNGSAISIDRPGHVTINTTPDAPVGVLLNDVVEGANIVMQIRGKALILGSNSGAAFVVGSPAIVAATGLTTGGTPLPAVQGDAVIIPEVAYNSATIARLPMQFKAAGF